MKINTNYQWPDNLYHRQEHNKNLIVLHHTAGHGGVEALNYLKKTASKTMREKGYSVGTAYFIEQNGEILQAFDDKYWAYHSASGKANDQRSVAIEIDNIGFLKQVGSQYYDLYGNNVSRMVGRFKVEPVILDKPWRGYKIYERYYDEQIDGLIDCLEYIFQRHPNIPRRIPKDFFPENAWPWWKHRNFQGILSHTHFLGANSKWDVSYAMKEHFDRIVEELNLEVV